MIDTLMGLGTAIGLGIAPFLFAVWLATGQWRASFLADGVVSGAVIFFALLAVVGFFLIALPWGMSVYWLRPATAALAGVGLIRYVLGGWRAPVGAAGGDHGLGAGRDPGPKARIYHGAAAATALAAIYGLAWAGPGYRAPTETLALRFPLAERTFVVTQGGASTALNYHYAHTAQKYAVDILALNSIGMRSNGGSELSDFVIWDAPVLAPCDGEVAFARDGLADVQGPSKNSERPAGNVVALTCGAHTVFLAHMRQGSVAVEAGDKVRAGAVLGRVGNSGNSSEPHLHIHAEAGPFKGEASANPGVAMTFSGRFLARNAVVRR